MSRTVIWSCGGGTQSAAIAALIIQGRLPKPDISLIVDTEREKSSTWKYLDDVLRPGLAAVGVEIIVVKKSDFAHWDLYKGDTPVTKSLLLPMFTTLNGPVPSKLSAFCSHEWKKRVCMRYLRSVGVDQCTNWLGISMDEPQRIKPSGVLWLENHYPLCYDVPMRRWQCVEVVIEVFGVAPPRSACWMCSNMGDVEWRDLHDNWPEDFQKAVLLEREVRLVDPHVFLHKSGVPLDQVDWTLPPSLFDVGGCESGYCFV